MNIHQSQWNQIQKSWVQNRMPQALLMVGPPHCRMNEFAIQVAKLALCQKASPSHAIPSENEASRLNPCSECINCNMVDRMEHPDIDWIKPEKVKSSIKIDQIRDMQNKAWLTPQRAPYRVIFIDSADTMNTASANALLKILEEPSEHCLFILMAQQLSTILPTILSRCHIFRLSSSFQSSTNLLSLTEHYLHNNEYGLILKDSETIIHQLIALMDKREHPCAVASLWGQYDLNALLWFLYLIFAQMQYYYFIPSSSNECKTDSLSKLANLFNPLLIFMQLDKIITLLKKLSHNININPTLALEDLLVID